MPAGCGVRGQVAHSPTDPGLWLANLSYAPQCQPLFPNGSGWVPYKEDAFAAYTHVRSPCITHPHT